MAQEGLTNILERKLRQGIASLMRCHESVRTKNHQIVDRQQE